MNEPLQEIRITLLFTIPSTHMYYTDSGNEPTMTIIMHDPLQFKLFLSCFTTLKMADQLNFFFLEFYISNQRGFKYYECFFKKIVFLLVFF